MAAQPRTFDGAATAEPTRLGERLLTFLSKYKFANPQDAPMTGSNALGGAGARFPYAARRPCQWRQQSARSLLSKRCTLASPAATCTPSA